MTNSIVVTIIIITILNVLLFPSCIVSFTSTSTSSTSTNNKRLPTFSTLPKSTVVRIASPFNQKYHHKFYSVSLRDTETNTDTDSIADTNTDSNTDTNTDTNIYKSQETDSTYDKPQPNTIPDEETLSNLPKLEQDFYSMMTHFSFYTPKDIDAISNPSYRALYEGVVAGSNEPLVMNAFAIIFSDLMPIRIAGRMIFKHLRNVMDTNIKNRIQEEERVQTETGLSVDAIDDGRRAFLAVLGSGENADKGTLTMTELVDSGIVEMVVELMEYDSFEVFVKQMEEDESEKINFEKFMVGLQKCALMKNMQSDDVFCDLTCDLEEVLSVTAQRLAPIEAKKREMTVSQRKQKYSDRYDTMVQSFEEWESLVPSGDGRMIQVLTGCFAGAKNEQIVHALKIVYIDYSALRVGGDLVFKLMGKLVNRKKKN